MATPTHGNLDGQWIDFYALLGVAVNADELAISKNIRRVFSEATANSDHRDLKLRHYYQSLAEGVLPQARRVLLDAQWRAKYDRQHILHSIGDPSAQDYVSFIAAMRGGISIDNGENDNIPLRVQNEISAARQAVETAVSGRELELLPSKTVISKGQGSFVSEVEARSPSHLTPIAEDLQRHKAAPAKSAPSVSGVQTASFSAHPSRERAETASVEVAEEPVFAQIMTAQEAAALRRQRAKGIKSEPVTAQTARENIINGDILTPRSKEKASKTQSRVVVGDDSPRPKKRRSTRLVSPASLNLMVGITGVLLTFTIQKFASTPAIATNVGRVPLIVAAAPELAGALRSAEAAWEKSPDGARYDLIVQESESQNGLARALGREGSLPDVWIPNNSMWAERYNALAPRMKREPLQIGASLAQTPLVLAARADHAQVLRARFPNHQIPSFEALREAVEAGASNHFGLSDPQKTVAGSVVRFAMAREWASQHDVTTQQLSGNGQFWNWMRDFEDNVSFLAPSDSQMIKEMVKGTSDRYWWAVGYESDALKWMRAGEPVEIYYLPTTSTADHPFCKIQRVGAPSDIESARASFEAFLRSESAQSGLLKNGLHPTEISASAPIKGNPFRDARFQSRGVRLNRMPAEARINFSALDTFSKAWAKKFN